MSGGEVGDAERDDAGVGEDVLDGDIERACDGNGYKMLMKSPT